MVTVKEIAHSIIEQEFPLSLNDILGDEVYRHSCGVCDYALLIAEKYELNLQQKIDLAIGSLLHDIGKGYVNQNILYKAERLTKDDRMIIECHPQLGFQVVSPSNFNQEVIDIVHYHHERLDGQGYPERLRSPRIGILTQIVSVADVFEALTADRVYHEKSSQDKAFAIMEGNVGLNQVAVALLKEALEENEKCED